MIIRLQSSEGSKRIECNRDDSVLVLYQKVQEAYSIDDIFGFSLFKDAGKTKPICMSERKSLQDYELKHGDIVYLNLKDKIQNGVKSSSSASFTPVVNSKLYLKPTQLDEVDKVLSKQDGLISRNVDAKLCRHGSNGKCVHCTPLEPFDQAYMKEHNIKHVSFHAYLRKLQSGIDKGKFAILEDISCKIKPGCKGHAPWPEGICTKCQPTAITLNPQAYRHVDSVTFENSNIVENFLNYWRITGHQRVGILYGYYDQFKDVPLGIRAHVVAIYEPAQESSRDMVKINFEQLDLKDVDFVANSLGYKRVGWVFTDLIPDANKGGTVKHLRGSKTYFLSAQECLTAGYLQNCHPNPCELSPQGYFGSKFVTVCLTGDKNNQVHMEAYQVSNQCMALVRDNCLAPTRDATELAYVKQSSREQYVPDVFYKEKDKYGNSVTQIARPLPIEYLLVDVPVSAPLTPTFTFNPLSHLKPFNIENRQIEGHLQDFSSFASYCNQFTKDQFLEAVSDFHLLVYFINMDTMPLRDSMEPLLVAIKNKDRTLALEWASNEKWSTVEQLILAYSQF